MVPCGYGSATISATTPNTLYRKCQLLKKLKYEEVIKNMKNKPDPALLQTSCLSNYIQKRAAKSRQSFPLK
jgi:hypothetical protein